MCTDNTATEPLCWWGKKKKTSWEDFNTSYPLREPESALFHRAIWSPVGAYTPTQQHEHGEQKTNTLWVGFKQPAKYCSWNRLHVQHQHLSSCSIHHWWWQLHPPVPYFFFFFERPPLYARTQQCIFIMLISKAYKHMCKRTHCAQPTQALVFSSHCQSTHSKSLSPARSLSQEAGCKLRARNVSCH